ncbi:hypothetical protein BH18CHL2_BH18CHL2_09940 [soil metagenome]
MNVHASLLPRHRGAAPVAHAILSGDADTGVTLMEGTPALDAGPILIQQRTTIDPTETAGELTDRLARAGGALLETALPRYIAGELRGEPQDEGRATWAPKVRPAHAAIDLARSAEELARRIRAFTPDPGAWTRFRGARLVIERAAVADGRGAASGTLELRDGVPHVAAGAGWLRLERVRPAGKRAMTGADWARGLRRLGAGERLQS